MVFEALHSVGEYITGLTAHLMLSYFIDLQSSLEGLITDCEGKCLLDVQLVCVWCIAIELYVCISY